MACLRMISRRMSLFPRQFCPSSVPRLHNNKDDSKFESVDSSYLVHKTLPNGLHNGDHGVGFSFKLGRYTSLARPLGSGFLLCRHMSSKSEELSDEGDCFGTFFEEETAKAVASQASTINEVAVAAVDSSLPVAGMQYVIDGVHAFTGLNWWASVVLTAFLVQGLKFPIMELRLKIFRDMLKLSPCLVEMAKRLHSKADDSDDRNEASMKELAVPLFSFVKGMFLEGFINVNFFLAIRNMAEKVPSFKTGGTLWFTDLTVPDSSYTLPILMGVIMCFSRELRIPIYKPSRKKDMLSRNQRLTSWVLASVAVQSAFDLESVVYCFLIPTRLMHAFAFSMATRNQKEMELLRHEAMKFKDVIEKIKWW